MFINKVETNAFVFEAALKIIEKVIKSASILGGKVYGDYVRNVLVPRSLKQPITCYNSVDFLFDNNNSHLFIKEMKSLYNLTDNHTSNWHDVYDLVVNDQFIASISISYQTGLLDMDHLFYYYKLGNPIFCDQDKHYSPDNVSESHFVTQILNKVFSVDTPIIPTNYKIYEPHFKQDIVDECNALIESGWTLQHKEVKITKKVTDDILTTLFEKKTTLEQYREVVKKYNETRDQCRKCLSEFTAQIEALKTKRNEYDESKSELISQLYDEKESLYEKCLKEFPNMTISLAELQGKQLKKVIEKILLTK